MSKALVVIDVQNYYINKDTDTLPDRIADHIKNNAYDHVLFTRFVNDENSSLSKILDWHKMQSSPDIDIHRSLSPIANSENTFDKNTYSIFKSSRFIDFLKSKDIDELILCGLDTDACILASQYDGFDMGYRVTVIVNLCACHSGASYHNAAVSILNKNLQVAAVDSASRQSS
jgi:nicotinamidase-related amidase